MNGGWMLHRDFCAQVWDFLNIDQAGFATPLWLPPWAQVQSELSTTVSTPDGSPASFVNRLAPRTISSQYMFMTQENASDVTANSLIPFMSRNLKFDNDRREIYLNSLARQGDVGVAALDADVCTETVRRHRQEDDEFAAAEGRARAAFLGHLRGAAYNRAIHGVVSRQTWDENENLIQEVRTYSDALLIKLLNRHDPEFRDSFKINATVDAQVTAKAAQQVDLEAAMKKLSPEKRAVLREILEEATEGIDRQGDVSRDEPRQLSEPSGQLSEESGSEGTNSQSPIDVDFRSEPQADLLPKG